MPTIFTEFRYFSPEEVAAREDAARRLWPPEQLAAMPPRELAKALICIDVARGYSIHDIVTGHHGMSGAYGSYSAYVDGRQVKVTAAQRQRWSGSFPLEQLMAKTEAAIVQELAGVTIAQQTLWSQEI